MTTADLAPLIGSLLSPLGLLTTGLIASLIRRPSIARHAGWLLIVIAMLCTSEPIARRLLAPLEEQALRIESSHSYAGRYQAIVLLGGSVRAPPAGAPADADPHLLAGADRVIHAARLLRQGTAPRIVVTGGRFDGDDRESEAQAMVRLLLLLGVDPSKISIEPLARTTHENALRVSELLGSRPATIALVTSAYHLPRAYEEFVRAGFEVDGYPTDWRTRTGYVLQAKGWLPNIRALEKSTLALHEWLGRLALRLRLKV